MSVDWQRNNCVSPDLRRHLPGPVTALTIRPDERSPIAIAYTWASRIIGVSLEMVIPGVLGFWLDVRLGTVCLFTVIGFSGGLVLGLWHLIRMTSPVAGEDEGHRTGGRNKR
jgi:hypothetical protein